MQICLTCGTENPGGARFCNGCAAPLAGATHSFVEERRVVTSLFCDLVGFTATSQTADVEDIDRMLDAYFEMARVQIESHGGVVEKFIGDAVVGVFGVSGAHEDDPERAVRAGLRITEDAEELESVGGGPLRVRVGINTGEAFVRMGVAPHSGEGFFAGDAINTASRLQSFAPEMGVAVGLSTYEATSTVFDYRELAPAALRGRAGPPVRVFHAKSPRARLGADLMRPHDTPFIGREIDLSLLKGTFDRTLAASLPQLVTVVGEPGMGKSRIVAELGAYVDSRPELINWRQGRCLPYGEGITFWALGAIVKAHAGILESDPPGVAIAKLDAVLPETGERAWFRQRLLPLLGIEASSSAERQELFTAWRRFLEHIADGSPTVLVFEDLHWADDAMLTFLEHLAGGAMRVPLLVVCAARPELFERRPDFAATLSEAAVISLSPLSEEETARLVAALLETATVPPELQRSILDRAGGNPLYAGEFVRLLKDRDLVVQTGSNWELREGAEVPFPDSVQALIAARLDTLAPASRSLLADAAVVGKDFWVGALLAMGRLDLSWIVETLGELARKDIVRAARRSAIEGEIEYSFRHALVRDVVYAQQPRASRAARHVGAARWIESKSPDRIEDLADVLAYHYATALELARAAGRVEEATQLEEPALHFLALATERALGLDASAALASSERALAFLPVGQPERPEALARFGQAAFQVGRFAEAAAALEEAIAAFRARGDLGAASRAMLMLGLVLARLADPRTWTLPRQALALLEPLPPGVDLVRVLTEVAVDETLQGRAQAGIHYAERALTLAEDLGLDRPPRALGYRGAARSDLGDHGGLEDLREAIVLATEAGLGREVALLHNLLGVALMVFEGPAASLHVIRAGIAFAHARGLAEMVDAMTVNTPDPLADGGELDEALAVVGALIERLDDGEAVADLALARASQARILSQQGKARDSAGYLDFIESTSRANGAADNVVGALGSSAFARAELGQEEAAAALLREIEATPGARENSNYDAFLSAMVRTALKLGDEALAQRLVRGVEPRNPYAEHALVAADAALNEAQGHLEAAAQTYAEAADRWERFGVVLEYGFALLGRGRCLVALGRQEQATPVLQKAREVFERVRAVPTLEEVDELLLGPRR